MGELKFDAEKAREDLKEGNKPKNDYWEPTSRVMTIHMPAALERIAELEVCLKENKKRWLAWMDTTDQQIIDRLREHLCEAEAISLHNFQRYQAAIGEGHIQGFDHRIGWSDLPEEQRKAIVESHRYMLECEGKL